MRRASQWCLYFCFIFLCIIRPYCCSNLKFKIVGSRSIGIAVAAHSDTVELGYNVTRGTEHIVLFCKCCSNREYNVMVSSEELIGTTEYMTLYLGVA